MSEAMALSIKQKALRLGYDACGIVDVAKMRGYAQKLQQRMALFPETKPHYEAFLPFAQPNQNYPWAKAVVVAARRYGKYNIPTNLRDLIGKYYLTDSRREPDNADYKDSVALEEFMQGLGLQTATERNYGITALRWAAQEAGLGLVRKNNFFYTNHGSWVYLEAWLINQKLELHGGAQLKPCPPACGLCVKACPTGSLNAPYTMNRNSCIACINAWEGWDLSTDIYASKTQAWLYGCDACQDACPFNKKAWSHELEFPGLAALAELIAPEKIVAMPYSELLACLQPRFWYIGKKNLWKWKSNALNAMCNCYKKSYRPYIEAALHDENEQVRRMANWVLTRV